MIVIAKTLEEMMMEDFLEELVVCDRLVNSNTGIHQERGKERKIAVLQSIEQLRKRMNDKSGIPPVTGGYHSQELQRFVGKMEGIINGSKTNIQFIQ